MRKTIVRNQRSSVHLTPKAREIFSQLLVWFSRTARDLPWRRTHDPYAVWVSEIMLQQTQVKTVIPYWERWMRDLPTIESLAKAKSERIHKLWEGLGYYTRVRNMQKAAQRLLADHDGKFPESFDSILALPGIGRYTAGAIASIAFNQPAPILDGNVIRVLCRLYGIGTNPLEKETNAKLWLLALELVQVAHQQDEHRHKSSSTGRNCSHLNQSLMELGALVCTPRSPDCGACPVARHCVARLENRVDELPRPKERAKQTERRFCAFIIEYGGKILVQQRKSGSVNAHLWEFPSCEVANGTSPLASAQKNFNLQFTDLTKLCEVKHSITRYRITTEAFRLAGNGKAKAIRYPDGVWKSRAQLRRLAFTAAHRRIEQFLEKVSSGT